MEFTARKVLSHRVRMLRSTRGWSQEVLADLSGLNRSYIGAVERTEHNIGLDNIEKIAIALGVSVADLVNSSQTPRIVDILGETGNCDPTNSVSSTLKTHTGATATINRKTFMQLLKHCQDNHQESIINYLRLCGVKVID